MSRDTPRRKPLTPAHKAGLERVNKSSSSAEERFLELIARELNVHTIQSLITRIQLLLAREMGSSWLVLTQLEDHSLELYAHAGDTPDSLITTFQLGLPADTGPAWNSVRLHQSVQVRDHTLSEHPTNGHPWGDAGTCTCFPLLDTQDSIWGVLILGHLPDIWSDETRIVLEAGIQKIGHAISLITSPQTGKEHPSAETASPARQDAFAVDLGTALVRAKRVGYILGVLIITFDGFEKLASEPITAFASELSKHLRQQDRLYRIEEERFAVILPELAPTNVASVLERVTSAALIVRRKWVSFNVNVGMASSAEAGTPQSLLSLAEERLYEQRALRRATTSAHGELVRQAMRTTLELLARDEDSSEDTWASLLEALVSSIAGAETGTLHVRERVSDGSELFRVRAQVGFSSELIDLTLPYAAAQDWYGDELGWIAGHPRVLSGQAIIQRSREALGQIPSQKIFEASGQLSQLQANLCVPVSVEGQVVALLSLDALSSEQAFSEDDLTLAEEFAFLVGMIFEARERRIREMDAISNVSANLRLVQHRQAIETTITEGARLALQSSWASIIHADALQDTSLEPASQIPQKSTQTADPSVEQHPEQHAVLMLAREAMHSGAVRRLGTHETTLLAIPLTTSRGENLGALIIARPRAFRASDVHIARSIASLGATALEREHAVAEEARRSLENALLLDLSRIASDAVGPREAAQSLLARMQEAFGLSCAIYLEQEGERLFIHALVGAMPATRPEVDISGIFRYGYVMQGNPFFIEARNRGTAFASTGNGTPLEGMLIHPERYAFALAIDSGKTESAPTTQHDPMSILCLLATGPRSWNHREQELIASAARTLFAALARLRAEDHVRAQADEFRLLVEMSEQLRDLDDPHQIAQMGLRTYAEQLEADIATCILRNPAFEFGIGAPTPLRIAQTELERSMQLGLTGRIVQQPLENDSPLERQQHNISVSATVPIIAHGQIVGALGLFWQRPTVSAPPTTMVALSGIAEHISRAIERHTHLEELTGTREGALLALGRALEARDLETSGHTERVVEASVRLGRQLDLSPQALEELRIGAYLHDIGKLSVPDSILHKPGELTPEEWMIMRTHTEIGDRLIADIPTIPPLARAVIRHHHEHWDGQGYPDGLAGESIPLVARIFSVVDIYDALTSSRPYKRAWTSEEARAELLHLSGTRLDPDVVEAFLEIVNSTQI